MSASGVLERSADVAGAVNGGDDGDGGGSRKVVLWVIALVLVPVVLFAGYTMFLMMAIAGASGGGSSQCTAGSLTTDKLEVQTTGGSTRTLGATELGHAATILSVARSLGVSARGQQIAIMTALQESGLKMYANSSVPESLDYPHDAVGSDHDSVNYFQQRVSG